MRGKNGEAAPLKDRAVVALSVLCGEVGKSTLLDDLSRLNVLEKKLAEASTNADRAAGLLATETQRSNDFEAKLTAAVKKMDESDARIRELEGEVKQMTLSADVKETELNDTRNAATSHSVKTAQGEAALNQIRTELKTSQALLERSRADLAKETEANQALNLEFETLKQAYNTYQSEHGTSGRDVVSLKSDLDNANTARDLAVQSKALLERQAKELNEKIKKAEHDAIEAPALRTSVSELERTVGEKQAEIDRASKTIGELKAQIAGDAENVRAAVQLERELADAMRKIQDAANDAEAQAKTANAKGAQAADAERALGDQIKGLQKTNDELRAKLQAGLDQAVIAADHKAKYEAEKAKVDTLEVAAITASEELKKLRSELGNLGMEAAKVFAENIKLNDADARATGATEAAEAKLVPFIDRLKEELAEVKRIRDEAARQSIADLDASKKERENAIAILNEEIVSLRATAEKVGGLKAEKEAAERRVGELKAERDEAVQKQAIVQKDLDECRKDNRQIDSENARLIAINKGLEGNGAKQDARIAEQARSESLLRQRMEGLAAEKTGLEHQISSLATANQIGNAALHESAAALGQARNESAAALGQARSESAAALGQAANENQTIAGLNGSLAGTLNVVAQMLGATVQSESIYARIRDLKDIEVRSTAAADAIGTVIDEINRIAEMARNNAEGGSDTVAPTNGATDVASRVELLNRTVQWLAMLAAKQTKDHAKIALLAEAAGMPTGDAVAKAIETVRAFAKIFAADRRYVDVIRSDYEDLTNLKAQGEPTPDTVAEMIVRLFQRDSGTSGGSRKKRNISRSEAGDEVIAPPDDDPKQPHEDESIDEGDESADGDMDPELPTQQNAKPVARLVGGRRVSSPKRLPKKPQTAASKEKAPSSTVTPKAGPSIVKTPSKKKAGRATSGFGGAALRYVKPLPSSMWAPMLAYAKRVANARAGAQLTVDGARATASALRWLLGIVRGKIDVKERLEKLLPVPDPPRFGHGCRGTVRRARMYI
jgi:chromosome segregation ATPase